MKMCRCAVVQLLASGHGNGVDMSVKVYDPAIHGADDVRRNRVREWLETNGVDTRFASVDSAVWVEGSNIHYLGHERNEDGMMVWSEEFQGPILDDMVAPLEVEWTAEDEEAIDHG